MELFRTEAEFSAYVEKRRLEPGMQSEPVDPPDAYPCLLRSDHYGKNGSGWWRWTMEFIYVEDVLELLQAAGLEVNDGSVREDPAP